MLPIKWFKGSKANKDQNTTIVSETHPVFAKLPDGRYILFVGSDGRQMKNLPQLSHVYTSPNPVTNGFGDINVGDTLENIDISEVVRRMLEEYKEVVLNSVSIDKNKFEIGQTLSGDIKITCNVSNSGNLNPGASTVSSSPQIFTQQSIDPLVVKTITVTNHTKNSPGSVSVTVVARGTGGEQSSKNANINWFAPIVFGSTSDTLIDTQAKFNNLIGKFLQSSRQGLYDFTGGYSHVLIPKTMSIANIGFTDIDLNTGNPLFSYDVTQQSDVTFNNGFINVDFYYFRSTNLINSPTRMQIT